MRVLKQHKINVTMMKNDRQEKRGRQGVRVLLEILGEGRNGVLGIGYQGGCIEESGWVA
jgi:hypothetical protein